MSNYLFQPKGSLQTWGNDSVGIKESQHLAGMYTRSVLLILSEGFQKAIWMDLEQQIPTGPLLFWQNSFPGHTLQV